MGLSGAHVQQRKDIESVGIHIPAGPDVPIGAGDTHGTGTFLDKYGMPSLRIVEAFHDFFDGALGTGSQADHERGNKKRQFFHLIPNFSFIKYKSKKKRIKSQRIDFAFSPFCG